MTIYLDTPLKQLYLNKLINIRAFNILTLANLYTIRDVLAFASPREKLLGLKHFGPLSYRQVTAILDLVNPQQVSLGEMVEGAEFARLGNLIQNALVVCYNELVASDDKIVSFFKTLFPDAESLHNWLSVKSTIPLIQNGSFSVQENIALRQLLLAYLDSVRVLLKKRHLSNKLLSRNYKRQRIFLKQNIRYVTHKDLVFKTDRDVDSVDLDALYEKLKATASGRTQHFLSRVAPSYQVLVPYMDKDIKAYRALNRGYPVTKVLKEVYDINQQLKVAYKATQREEEVVETTTSKGDEFPFLNDSQRAFVNGFFKGHGYYPMFYVLYHYLRFSDKRRDLFYSLHYGIKDGMFHPIAELAERFAVQPRSIKVVLLRQLGHHRNRVLDTAKWINYKSLFDLAYLTAETPEVRQLCEEENLELPFSVFSRLLALVGDISQDDSDAKPFKVFSLDGRLLVVNSKRLPRFKADLIYRLLEKYVQKRDKRVTNFDLHTVIKGMPFEHDPVAFELLRYMACSFLHLNVSDEGVCKVARKDLDIASVMCDLLSEANKPLSLSELFSGFKQRYPDETVQNPKRLKPYLYRCGSICAIGKTGNYGLRSWDHVFFGSMQDYLFHVLHQADEPMSLSDLTALAVKNYPETYERSVQSTMHRDRRNRFVQLQNGYYGLRTKQYDNRFIETDSSISGFDERLAAFRAFVEHHKRYPVYSNSETEASLSRWFHKVSNGTIQLTHAEKQVFSACVSAYEAKLIPRNRIESRFKQQCDLYKAFIRKEGHIPSHLDGKLYDWKRRAQISYPSFTDFRRRYFDDLLRYMRSLGLGE